MIARPSLDGIDDIILAWALIHRIANLISKWPKIVARTIHPGDPACPNRIVALSPLF